tara:strand:- start:402 stop:1574 length:1173 start_codon:yes stop_codon:yes gene_type:complete
MTTVFSKQGCKNCEIIKNVLEKIGIKFNEIKLNGRHQLEEYIGEKCFEINEFPVVKHLDTILTFNEAYEKFNEPILNNGLDKYIMYPIKNEKIYEMYKKARASYWQPEEISLSKDLHDWESLTDNERKFISYILAFFATSDGIVNENLNSNFANEVELPEARAFYAFQEAIEAVHAETYSILLDKFITNKNEKRMLQNGISEIKTVKKKAEWAFKYMNNEIPFNKRIVAFACIEGIYFSGSFCALFWLKKRNLLPGLCFSNELISRDEGMHTDFAVLIYKNLKNKLPEDDIKDIIKTAVINEKEFIIEAVPCNLIGMNKDLMGNYIEYVADRLVQSLGYNKIYGTENPFEFMENISLEGKTNFFEKRVGEYAKAGVMNNEELQFTLDEAF